MSDVQSEAEALATKIHMDCIQWNGKTGYTWNYGDAVELIAAALAKRSAQPVAGSILIGGNHLASALINLKCFPDKQTDYNQVLEEFGQPCADMWVCWKAIMDARNAAAPPPPVGDVGDELLKFVEEVKKYTAPWAIDQVENTEVFRKAMRNIHEDACKALAARAAGEDEIPEGWQIESIIAEKLRVPIEDYECVLCHPQRLCDLAGEPYKVHGIGNTVRDAVLNAISKIPVGKGAA